jgi:hypothetical protein
MALTEFSQVTDASGEVSPEAHGMAVRRMVQARIVPITWMALLWEWQRDWARIMTLSSVSGRSLLQKMFNFGI